MDVTIVDDIRLFPETNITDNSCRDLYPVTTMFLSVISHSSQVCIVLINIKQVWFLLWRNHFHNLLSMSLCIVYHSLKNFYVERHEKHVKFYEYDLYMYWVTYTSN